MRVFKMFTVLGLTVLLSGCFGGGLIKDGKAFTAHGGTFNFITMKWDLENGLGSSAIAIAEAHVPSGATITNVSTEPHWRSAPFPWVIGAFLNEYFIGWSACQIGGTSSR